jgi:signal transduction histidine kinase
MPRTEDPTRSADTPASSRHPARAGDRPGALFWLGAVAAFTAIGLLRFAYRYLDDVARGQTGTFAARAIEEFPGAYAALLLFVGVEWVARRWPLDRRHWRRHLPVHVVALVVYSVVHTGLMALSRVVLFPLAGLGAYDYGRFPVRFFMEFQMDAIAYAVFIAFLTLRRYTRALRERELRAAELERALAQAQLQSLRLRLQPHFLFNALNTISSTMYDDPAAADAMIGQLGELLRRSLQTEQTQEVALREEVELLRDYVAIMRARFGDALRITLDIDPAAERAAIPSLLLQPLVENAVRHGAAARAGRGAVEVRARRADGAVLLEVADDGPGVPDGRDVIGSGVGLAATADRLRLLYGDAHHFAAGNRPGGGFLVSVRLPFRALPEGDGDDARPHR